MSETDWDGDAGLKPLLYMTIILILYSVGATMLGCGEPPVEEKTCTQVVKDG